MLKKLSVKANIIISIIAIFIAITIFLFLNDVMKGTDEELKSFFAGMFLALGIGNIFRVFLLTKKS